MEAYLLVAGGLALLVGGCELLVRGAVDLARALGVSPFLIGITLVAWGTSAPELVTSVTAALAEAPGIVVGNIVGTNTANILLILGLCAAIQPFVVDAEGFRRDSLIMITTSLILLGLVFHGVIERPVGAAMIVVVIVFAVRTYRADRAKQAALAAAATDIAGDLGPDISRRPGLALLLTIAGLAIVIVGARLLVEGAVDLARLVGVSETVIGLTVVAIGTSAPELTMAIVGALRRQSELAYANVIGSHIYNTLFILGFTALVEPIAIPPEIIRFDIWVMVAATVLLVVAGLSGRRLSRFEGLMFVTAYIAYVWRLLSVHAA